MIGYIVTAISIVGSCANACGKRWSFAVWMVTNLYFCVYNIAIAEYPQAVLFFVNLIIAAYGLRNWRKHREEN